MLNLVEKYSAETPEVAEDGVVTIEYVLLAVGVAALVTAIATYLGGASGALVTKLKTVI